MTDLVINFFPISFSSTSAEVFAGRRKDSVYRESLRKSYPEFVVWPDRTDSDRLYLWSLSDSSSPDPKNFVQVTVQLSENPFLFERLIQDAVEKRLLNLGFQQRGYREFINFDKGNLLEKIEPLSNATREPIGIYPKIIVDAFFTASANGELKIGLVVDILYATQLEISLAEWLAAGVKASNRSIYVKLLSETPEAQSYPDCVGLTIGKIKKIEGDWIELEDLRRRDLYRIKSSSVTPEPRREYLYEYLEARYRRGFNIGERELAEHFRKLISPKERHRLIKALVNQRLMKTRNDKIEPLMLAPDLTASLGEMRSVSYSDNTFPVLNLRRPPYSFDPVGNKTSRRPDKGLQSYGPYSQEKTRHQDHNILVVSPREYKGVVQQVIRKLDSGIKLPNRSQVFSGLRQMYRLSNLQYDESYFSLGRSAPMKYYGEAIHQAIIEKGREGKSYDLAIVVIRDDFENLPDSENPYYQSKGFLLQCNPAIPTQAVKIETLRVDDYTLQYSLNNIALACYAKMGGTPYVMRTSGVSSTELIFGIGRAVIKESRFGTGEQTIGFSTVFRANGEYIYNDCTPYCDPSTYRTQLETTIRRSVKKVTGFEQIAEGEDLRLVFHVYKRTGKQEVQAIKNALGKLTRYNIEYALVHVNEDHHFHVFDQDCQGVWKGYKDNKHLDERPALLPQRGTSVKLGPRERLITFIGPKQYLGYGCPRPIRITLDKSSTFQDVDYLAQQLFELSFMNARSLTPGIKPVTILYSEFLADLIGHLRSVQQWTVELVQQKLSQRLWFI